MNQNTKQKRSAASWLAELAKGRYGEYALSVLTALLGVACSLIPYFIIIRLITALVNGTAELPRCLTLCAWMAGCWVLRYVLHSVSTSLSHHATFHVLANTRVRLLDKLATLPLGTVLDRSSGSYKNIVVERVDSIETTLAHLLPEMTANIVGALAVLVLLAVLYINGKLDLIHYDDGTVDSVGTVDAEEDQDLDTTGLTQATNDEMEMPEGSPFADEDVLNILLVSTDERTDAVNDWDAFTHLNELDGTKATTEFSSDARADSLILCSLNIKDDTIKLVSIERGTGVPILLDGYEGQYDWITHTFRYAVSA